MQDDTSSTAPGIQRPYWSFYWPLALTGLAMVLAAQFKNGVLSRYPDAIQELAVFAIAGSIMQLCRAGIIFVPQMINVLARNPQATVVCLRFTIMAALALSLPLLLFGFTPLGGMFIPVIFKLESGWLTGVTLYLQLLSPMILIGALGQFFTGLLVQSKRTGLVTMLNGVMLTTTILVLFVGLWNGIDATWVISASHVLPALLHLILTVVCYQLFYRAPETERTVEALSYGKALRFFYPVAFTSTMFATSRPLIYAFISYTSGAALTIAILRICFDFTMMFYNMLNQFRHLFVTFGAEDPAGVRRFMIRIFGLVITAMLIIAITPLHQWFIHYLLGVENMLHVKMAQEAILVLCLIPMFLTLRNYFHGVALVEHKTGRMGLAGVMRISSIFCFTAVCYYFEVLNHMTGAGALVAGFMAEGTAMWLLTRRSERRQQTPVCTQVATE